MEEQQMKRLFSIILMTMLGFMTKAWADNISIESGKIAPNSTKIVSVVLNNTATNYVGFQMDFYLPKGLSIDKSKTTLTDRAEPGSSITIGKQSNGAFRIVYSSLNLTPIKGTGGALINLCLKASADYAGGSAMVKNVVFGTTDSKTVRMDNVSFDMQQMTSVTVTANTIKMKYGDAVPELTYQKNDPSVKGTPTLSCEATSTSPVGTYPIVISKGSIEADEVKCVNGSLIIEKAPLTISAGNYTKKQGEPMPVFKAVYNGFKNNENEEVLTKKPVITTTATKSSAPGSYPVTVSGAEAQNYDISYQPGTLTITKADAVIITARSYSRTYGDNNPTFEYDVQGAQLDGVPEITCEATKGSPVGTYAIVVKQGTVKNYNVTFANGTLTVTKAPLTVSAGNYTKKQGDPMPEFKASYQGFKNNETEDVLTKKPVITTTATKSSAPGSYPVTVSGAEAQNYDISYQPGTLTITKADAVIITARSYSRVYGDNNPTLEYELQGAQLDGVPEITCEATKGSPVGTYAIVVKQGTVKNYNVTFANGTLTVTKAPLTISAGNYTKKQGDPMPALKAVYNGFKNNENEEVLTKKPVITTTATKSSAPGSYPVTVSGAEAQNYDISYQPGTLAITKADAVIITARSYSRVYGDNNPTFEYEVQGAQLDGVPEITCEATKGSPVGTYAIVVKQGTVKNYNVTFANGTLTVTKAPLTVSAGNYTKKQGGPMPEFKASYQGFKNNETEDVLTKKPVITTTATESSAPGSYPVTVSGAEAQNYDISYQPGTLSVTEADAVIISAKSYSRTYGDNNPTFEYEVQGAQLDGVPEITCEATKNSPVGTYTIVVKQGTVKNYNVTFANGTLTVTKAPLTISAGNYTKKQGNPMPEFKANYDGFKNNETEVVLTKKPVITTTATESSAPGEYLVTVSGAEGQNYDISYQQGTLTVTEAEVSDPVITLNGNELSISCGTARAIIYYTLNGKDPDENSPVYTEPIPLEASCQIKVVAKLFDVKSNIVNSEYHNPQYPDIIKVGDVITANIINNGVDSLPLYFKVTSIYPFEAELVRKEDYMQGWTNEYHIFGDLEVPAEVNCRNIKFKVVSIGELALSYCTHTYNLKLNEGLETIQHAAFRFINNIKELVIPNSVKRIEGTFVTECHSLKSITLGKGLQSLGMYAFWYVDGLRYIYSLNPIPPTFDDPNHSFDDTPVDKITLYVPIGSKTAYENAPGWNLFAGRIVEIDPTGIVGVTADGLSITVSNHRIHVEGAKVGSILNVYDLSGNKCMSVRITSGNADINCTIPNGVYVIRLGNVSKKVVV